MQRQESIMIRRFEEICNIPKCGWPILFKISEPIYCFHGYLAIYRKSISYLHSFLRCYWYIVLKYFGHAQPCQAQTTWYVYRNWFVVKNQLHTSVHSWAIGISKILHSGCSRAFSTLTQDKQFYQRWDLRRNVKTCKNFFSTVFREIK